MKILYLFLFAFTSCTSSSQKNFEGVITYEMDSPKGYRSEMKATYGKNHIKTEALMINNQTGEIVENKTTIYDIFNGINYEIDSELGHIEFDSLKYQFPEDMGIEFISTDTTKQIQNQPCRLFLVKAILEDTSAMVPQSKMSIWFSEDIKYIIPKEYRNKRSLLANNEGNIIWLESKVIFKMPRTKTEDTVWVRAKSVKQTTIHDTTFKLPGDYILKYISPKKDNSYKTPVSKTDYLKKIYAVKPVFCWQITTC